MPISTREKARKVQRRILDWVAARHPALFLDKRAEFFTRMFERHLEPGSTVLDIGGGWGYYAEPLRRRGHHAVVLDVVKPGFQFSPVVMYDGRGRFPFPDKSFDASLLITVLHHLPDPEAVVREVRRVTRKTLIVVEDLYHHALGRLWTRFRDMLFNFEFVGHPCQFRKKNEWIRFFSRMGFELEASSEAATWVSGLRVLNGLLVFRCGT